MAALQLRIKQGFKAFPRHFTRFPTNGSNISPALLLRPKSAFVSLYYESSPPTDAILHPSIQYVSLSMNRYLVTTQKPFVSTLQTLTILSACHHLDWFPMANIIHIWIRWHKIIYSLTLFNLKRPFLYFVSTKSRQKEK